MLPDSSVEVCRNHLEPYHGTFWHAFERAFAQFRSLTPDHQRIFSTTKRSKTNVMWAFFMEEANKLMANDAGVVPHTIHETTTFEIKSGQIETRLKKVTPEGISRNYPTKRARAFHTVGQFEIFSDLWSAPIRVDVGYVPDDTGLNLAQVLVVFRQGNNVVWMYEIERPESGAVVLPITTPVPGPATPARVVAKRGAAKGKRKDKKASGDAGTV